MKDRDIEVARSISCFVPASRTMIPSSIWGVEYFEDFDNVFVYHTFLYDWAIASCPFGV
jgi:hypothetical protein